MHLGFEVKVDVDLSRGGDCWVQLSGGTAADLGLEPGQRMWVTRTDSVTSPLSDGGDDRAVPSLST